MLQEVGLDRLRMFVANKAASPGPSGSFNSCDVGLIERRVWRCFCRCVQFACQVSPTLSRCVAAGELTRDAFTRNEH
jgi:hypothetical protein